MKIIIIGFLAMLFFSCSDSDPSPVVASQAPSVTAVRNNIISTTWIITKYEEGATEKTADFDGYSFDFLTNGTLNSSKDGNTFAGSWNTSSQDGITKLIFSIASSPDLSSLNRNWIVLESTLLLTRMEDDASDGTKYVIELKKQ